ncbi:MAG TPA: dTDP-4-dehydrorhamnose reductase [Acidimicrobiales bacterium]|nr:dTDP-4-dehydrorhamnose reductase [Acidimicrobiales bacterium]
MKVLVTGAAGQLGRDLVDALSGRVPAGGLPGAVSTGRLGERPPVEVVAADVAGLDAVPTGHRAQLDITDRSAVGAVMETFRPDVVIHGAAWTAVDACEADPDRAFAVNALGTRNVAEGARRQGAHLVYISTDYVFDGTSARPYLEWDTPHPLSVYGRSKWGGEQEVGPGATIVRISWVSGAHGTNMVRTVLRLAADPGTLRFVDDQRGSPTFTADLAGALTVLATERLPGIFHVTNQGVTSWYEFAREVLAAAGDDPSRVEPITTADLDPPRAAPRPANSVLDNAVLRLAGLPLLPDWRDALARLVPVFAAPGQP